MGKIGYLVGKYMGKMKKLGILWGKKFKYGKNWVSFRYIKLNDNNIHTTKKNQSRLYHKMKLIVLLINT